MDEAQTTVLLVDDDDAVRRLLTQMLQDHGFQAVATRTAEDGLAAFESNPAVSLAILDMMLPGQSGLDLAAELERRRPGFRILYISGAVDSIAMESIARRAPEVVLLKPFGKEELIERVKALAGVGHSAFPWAGLVEASDPIAKGGTQLMSYRDTAAGFAMATAHVAVLRAAGVSYAFRMTGDVELPLALRVLPNYGGAAMALLERIGLGADIAPAV